MLLSPAFCSDFFSFIRTLHSNRSLPSLESLGFWEMSWEGLPVGLEEKGRHGLCVWVCCWGPGQQHYMPSRGDDHLTCCPS